MSRTCRWHGLVGLAALLVTAGARAQSELNVRLPDGTVVGYKHQATETPEENLRAMRRTCRKHIGRAKKFIERENWYRARLALRLASGSVTDPEHFQQVRDLLLRLEQAGRSMLDQARKDARSQRWSEAIEQLTIISYTFEGLPVGHQAREDLQNARSNPQVQAALENLKALDLRAQIDRVLDAATPDGPSAGREPNTPTSAPAADDVERIMALPATQQLRVVSLMETIVEAYGRTQCGRRTEAILDRLKRNETFMETLSEHRKRQQARRALNAAHAFGEAGLMESARQRYRQVVRDHPRTPAGVEARRRLAELEGVRSVSP